MKIFELIQELQKYPSNFDVCIGFDLDSNIDMTYLSKGMKVSKDLVVKTDTISIW